MCILRFFFFFSTIFRRLQWKYCVSVYCADIVVSNLKISHFFRKIRLESFDCLSRLWLLSLRRLVGCDFVEYGETRVCTTRVLNRFRLRSRFIPSPDLNRSVMRRDMFTICNDQEHTRGRGFLYKRGRLCRSTVERDAPFCIGYVWISPRGEKLSRDLFAVSGNNVAINKNGF